MRPLRVLFLESFFSGSHAAFAEGYAGHSRHEVDLYTLPGREWRRRQRLAGWSFAERCNASSYDVVLAGDLLDLADFVAAQCRRGPVPPLVLYMHETQCTYPLPAGKSHNADTVFFDLKNCWLADRVVFNSTTHRNTFLETVEPRLAEVDEIDAVRRHEEIRQKAAVVYPGVEVAGIRERAAREPAAGGEPPGARPPTIVWNHRWEYDKNPPAFFRALAALADEDVDFRLVLLGENPQAHPTDFEDAQRRFADRLRHVGYAASRDRYLELLSSGDIVVSTATQENFGIATVEAIAAGCRPVLPKRLSYPELIPRPYHSEVLYTSQRDLVEKLRAALTRPELQGAPTELRDAMMRFDWRHSAPALDAVLDEVIERRSSTR
jgi:glycosyltransferase involved in cell wall biosynthesis